MMMKKIILSLILALAAQFSFAAVPDSLKKDLEDYDYLVSFVEENYLNVVKFAVNLQCLLAATFGTIALHVPHVKWDRLLAT